MRIAPLPPFLLYDGINGDINAALLYERVLHHDTHDLPIFQHAKQFLWACLSRNNIADVKPFVAHMTLLQVPSIDARRWANPRFRKHFPTLNAPTVGTPGSNLNPPPPPPQLDIAAQIAAYMAATGNSFRRVEEEKKDEDTTGLSGMSTQEMSLTLQMCGKPSNGTKEDLPLWFLDVAAKATQDAFKNLIIRKNIETNTLYEDADVPLTAQLIKMVNKRNWCGKESNSKRPSLLNATEGLSPFIVLDLDEDQVAILNYNDDAITSASHTTVDDILRMKKRATAKVPESSEDFMLLLRTFANLLFALFSKDCPFLLCVVQIITALKQFSRNAREAMSITTKASILWVVLLQGRQFATGHMDVLAEFSALHSSLVAKQANIYHAEVPAELFKQKSPLSQKRSFDDAKPSIQTPPEAKKPKLVGTNLNTWHPKLKEKIGPALRKAGYPRFMTILEACDVDADQMYKKFGGRCTPNTMFGSCFAKGACKRDHSLPSSEEVEEILTLTKKFFENPTPIKTGS